MDEIVARDAELAAVRAALDHPAEGLRALVLARRPPISA